MTLALLFAAVLGFGVSSLILAHPSARRHITLAELVRMRSPAARAARAPRDVMHGAPILPMAAAERLLRAPLIRAGDAIEDTMRQYRIGDSDRLLMRLRQVYPGMSVAAFRARQFAYGAMSFVALPTCNVLATYSGITLLTPFGQWHVALWLLACALGAWWPFLRLRDATNRRRDHMAREVPVMFDLFVLGSSAAQSPEVLLRNCGQYLTGPLGAALAGVAREADTGGLTHAGGLRRLAYRDQLDAVRQLADAWELTVKQGTPFPPAMLRVSENYQQRRENEMTEELGKLGTKMLAPLLLLMVPAFMLATVYPLMADLLTNIGGAP